MDVIRAIRNLRTEMNCPPGKEVQGDFLRQRMRISLFCASRKPYLRSLGAGRRGRISQAGDRPKGAATAVVGATEIYLPLDDLVNLDEERARLAKEVGKVEDELARVQKKLANNDFLAKAKDEVVQKEREKASQFEEKIRTLRSSLEKIQEIQAGRS